MKAVRNSYSELGVETYYKKNGATYCNPHFAQIADLIRKNENQIDYSNSLDFCCGSGEVSAVLHEMGYKNTTASDPYTGEAYTLQMGKVAEKWSFQDVIVGKLEGYYSTIICSFAMHLCPEKQLFPLVQQLFQHSTQLVIITPHKRPDLSQVDGVQLDFEDHSLTARGKKVRLRGYSFSY